MTETNSTRAEEIKKLRGQFKVFSVLTVFMVIVVGAMLYLNYTADEGESTTSGLMFLPLVLFDFFMLWSIKKQIREKLS